MSGTLRMATSADAPAIQRIYAPYVEETPITFETTVPAVETLASTLSETLRRDPWLVYEHDDGVVGYAYAGSLPTSTITQSRTAPSRSADCERIQRAW
jgi:phosphinothricin acetyltransferase